METVIKVSPAELNLCLPGKIKAFIGNKSNVDITITFHEFANNYADTLDRSLEQGESNMNPISMTMEEFVTYSPKKQQ
jgi:hypothetical protein